jgi:hypothetical protein
MRQTKIVFDALIKERISEGGGSDGGGGEGYE